MMVDMLTIYNSATQKKQEFRPLNPPSVTMYNCGPTVYNYAHIGNLRSFVAADIFRRTLEFNGFAVSQVINITDVGHLTDDDDDGEDKIELKARQERRGAHEIVTFFTDAFFKDIKTLNIKTEGTEFPRASEHIDDQIELIKILEEKGYTYRTSEGIYFNTSKLPHYDVFKTGGGNTLEGARIEINSEKLSHTDFALWKFSPTNQKRQQEWDSPWGVGFPGWHLECSAMSMKYLGETLDIHTGGIDHKFPHHPNEIAQSERSTGKPFARYWIHTEFVTIEGGKMAKSEENFITLQTLQEKGFDPLSYRYWLLTAHYRSPVNFSWEALTAAENAYTKLRNHALSLSKESSETPDESYLLKLSEALNDDFDTPKVVALMWKLIKDRTIKKPQKKSTLKVFDSVLGLDLFSAPQKDSAPKEVWELAREREKARENEEWERADELRESLREHGFEPKDTENGTELRPLTQ